MRNSSAESLRQIFIFITLYITYLTEYSEHINSRKEEGKENAEKIDRLMAQIFIFISDKPS